MNAKLTNPSDIIWRVIEFFSRVQDQDSSLGGEEVPVISTPCAEIFQLRSLERG